MSVASETISRVRAILPDSESRFSDALLTQYATMADSLVRERTGMTMTYYDISLTPRTIYYGLPSDVIQIKGVLYSGDGTTFDDGTLNPVSFRDLDEVARFWKDETGSRPEYFGVLGTPGTPGCYLFIWRPVVDTGKAIRVNYLGTSSSDMESRYIDLAVLPYVMSLIYAQDDFRLFNYWFGKYQDGVEKISREFSGRLGESTGGPHQVPMSGSNL